MNYRFTLDTFDWPSIQCGYPPSRPELPRHVHRGVRLPAGGQRSESSAGRSRSEGGALAGVHARPRPRAESHDVAGRAVRAQVGGLRGGGDLRAAADRRGLRREQSRLRLGQFPLGPAPPAQPQAVRDYNGIEVRLRKRFAERWSMDTSYLFSYLRGNWSGLASSDEAVGSLQPILRPRVQPALLLVRRGWQPDVRPARHRSAAPVQATGHLRHAVGHDDRLQLPAESGVPLSSVANQKGMAFFPVRPRRSWPSRRASPRPTCSSSRTSGCTALARVVRCGFHQPVRSEDGDGPKLLAVS